MSENEFEEWMGSKLREQMMEFHKRTGQRPTHLVVPFGCSYLMRRLLGPSGLTVTESDIQPHPNCLGIFSFTPFRARMAMKQEDAPFTAEMCGTWVPVALARSENKRRGRGVKRKYIFMCPECGYWEGAQNKWVIEFTRCRAKGYACFGGRLVNVGADGFDIAKRVHKALNAAKMFTEEQIYDEVRARLLGHLKEKAKR